MASRKNLKRGGRYTPPTLRHPSVWMLVYDHGECEVCALLAALTIPESDRCSCDDCTPPRNEERPTPDRVDRSDTRPNSPRRDQ